MKSRTSVRTGGTAHMQNYKTEELVRQAKRQDADAFTELMRLHMKDMSRVAYSILMNDEDVADAVQETILTCWEKLSGVSEKYRIVVVLFYNEGYRISEISKMLGRPPSTIRTQLARGREQLAKYYQDEEGSM